MYKIFIGLMTVFMFLFIGLDNIHSIQTVQAQGWTEGHKVVSGGNTGLPETEAGDFVLNILNALLGLVFFLAILAFVASGIIFIMSFNNSNLITMAKDWLTYAVIGLVVSVLGYVIILFISNVLIGQKSGDNSGGSGPIVSYSFPY